MLPYADRLAFRQARIVLVIAFVLGTMTAAVQIYLDHDNQYAAFESSISRMTESIRQSASNALWELNGGLAHSIIGGLFGNRGIVGAELVTTSNFVLAKSTRKAGKRPLDAINKLLFGDLEARTIPLTYIEKNGQKTAVGSLSLTVDHYPVTQRFIGRAAVIFVTGIIKSIILSIVILAAFYVTLTKPLTLLAEQLSRIDLRNPDAKDVVRLKRSAQDELAVIADISSRQFALTREHLVELRDAHDNLRAANKNLENAVEQRTNDLSEEIDVRTETENRLRVAAEEALRFASTRSVFLSNMSHELRTPLNAILGYSDIALQNMETLPPDKLREYFSAVQASGSHLLELVNSILDFSRLESGRMPIRMETTDITELVRNVAQHLSIVIKQNGNMLQLDLADDVPPVETDRMKLRQVLINLIGNAAKFTADGVITVSVLRSPPPEDSIDIRVDDTGIGIHPSKFEKIFESFEQGDNSVVRRHGGTGLGLAIVKKTCERMGWRISVTSEPGMGSSFRLVLPLHDQPIDEPAALEPTAPV